MVSTAAGTLGIEIKQGRRVGGSDCRALHAVAAELGRQWPGGLVVYRGDRLEQLDRKHDLWAMPVERLL